MPLLIISHRIQSTWTPNSCSDFFLHRFDVEQSTTFIAYFEWVSRKGYSVLCVYICCNLFPILLFVIRSFTNLSSIFSFWLFLLNVSIRKCSLVSSVLLWFLNCFFRFISVLCTYHHLWRWLWFQPYTTFCLICAFMVIVPWVSVFFYFSPSSTLLYHYNTLIVTLQHFLVLSFQNFFLCSDLGNCLSFTSLVTDFNALISNLSFLAIENTTFIFPYMQNVCH